MELKVMSYNIAHCRNVRYEGNYIDFDAIAAVIKDNGAEIIGLNEVYDEGLTENFVAQAKILAEKLGYSYYYFGQTITLDEGDPYGNALISKYPIVSVKKIPIPQPVEHKYNGYYEDRCLIVAEIDVKGTILTVMVSHFGLNPDEAENAVNAVIRHLPAEKTVLMGDFNLKPDNELLLPIREKLFDTAELFAKETFSFPSTGPRVKIDYIFTSHDIQVKSADIPCVVASDHCPHVALLEI